MTIQFFVPGPPQPGGSKKAFVVAGKARVVDDAKNNKPWRDRVAAFALAAHPGPPLDVPLYVEMCFFVPRPRGHYGTGRNSHTVRTAAPPYPAKRPDVLKLARSTEDALTGVLWRDDCLTVVLHLAKLYAPARHGPGVRVTVKRLGTECGTGGLDR